MTEELEKAKASLASLASNILSADPGKQDLSAKTKAEIKVLAKDLGISVDGRLTKPKMIEFLESSEDYIKEQNKIRARLIKKGIRRAK